MPYIRIIENQSVEAWAAALVSISPSPPLGLKSFKTLVRLHWVGCDLHFFADARLTGTIIKGLLALSTFPTPTVANRSMSENRRGVARKEGRTKGPCCRSAIVQRTRGRRSSRPAGLLGARPKSPSVWSGQHAGTVQDLDPCGARCCAVRIEKWSWARGCLLRSRLMTRSPHAATAAHGVARGQQLVGARPENPWRAVASHTSIRVSPASRNVIISWIAACSVGSGTSSRLPSPMGVLKR
jgi:hypothetical protein